VELGLLGQAVGMSAVTNIDDMLVLAVFFGQAADRKAQTVQRLLSAVAVLF
jgi:cadmium resistance protein CadD (predicted permease)